MKDVGGRLDSGDLDVREELGYLQAFTRLATLLQALYKLRGLGPGDEELAKIFEKIACKVLKVGS